MNDGDLMGTGELCKPLLSDLICFSTVNVNKMALADLILICLSLSLVQKSMEDDQSLLYVLKQCLCPCLLSFA